jgi:polyhydroxyalkanoate synthesis regulator phasin
MISWKYTFKRLNEEYDLATKKKQAIDSLCASGKISQQTRDSFTEDIVKAITEIEKQRQDLGEKMQAKTQELENQLKTLEMLLANYEIQHVVGEIDEELYVREINLLSITLETTKNELGIIKDATNQLFGVSKPVEAPATPEITPPKTEAPVESAPMEIPVETATIESANVETVPAAETTSVEPTPLETLTMETTPAESAPIESAPTEAPVEIVADAPVENAELQVPAEASFEETATVEAPVEIVADAPLEDAVVDETLVETAEVYVVADAPLEDAAAVETDAVEVASEAVDAEIITEVAPVESSTEAAPAEDLPLEDAVVEVLPAEETLVADAECPIEVTVADLPDELVFEESVAEASLDIEPSVEASYEEAIVDVASDIIVPAETVDEQVIVVANPVIEAPLQVFEVTEHAPIETTLEKIMEPAIEEPIIQSVIVEEAHIPAHPLEAPQQAHSDEMVAMETDTDQTTPTDESDENTTEEE